MTCISTAGGPGSLASTASPFIEGKQFVMSPLMTQSSPSAMSCFALSTAAVRSLPGTPYCPACNRRRGARSHTTRYCCAAHITPYLKIGRCPPFDFFLRYRVTGWVGRSQQLSMLAIMSSLAG